MKKILYIATIMAVTALLIIVISKIIGFKNSIIPAAIILPVLYYFNKNKK